MNLPSNRSTGSSPKIVIPIVAGIGNAILAQPMVRRLRDALPHARITIVARTKPMAEPFRDAGVESLAGTCPVRGIRSCRADIILVPFPSNRWQYSMLALTSRAPRKILHGYPRHRLRTLGFVGERVPAVRGLHDVQQNLNLLQALGIDPGKAFAPSFPLHDQDHARAEALLREIGIIDHPFIAIHAGSADTILARAKRWPAEKYGKLIESLRSDYGHEIVVVEGPDESGVADEIARHAPSSSFRKLKLTGPLAEAAAVLNRAALYAGSDSGLAHLAAAVGTRAVTLFAPADPDRVCPFGNRDLVVKSCNDCSPCFMYPWQTPYPKVKCRAPFCIDGIEVQRVLERVKIALPVGLKEE